MEMLKVRNKTKKKIRVSQIYYHLMLLPGMIFLLIFHYAPMGGLVMAFQNFKATKGIFRSEWVGFAQFERLFSNENFFKLIRNTVVIALGKILIKMIVAVAFAILLNEIKNKLLKKSVQTIVYLPHFLSWAILAPMVFNMLGLTGMVNDALAAWGFERINFIGSNDYFQGVMIGTGVWKDFGYASIVYLAAITAVDPGLHEAAAIDGAPWWKRVWYVTLPAMLPIIILMLTRDIATVLSAGFDQVYNMYSVRVYETGDILDTYVYRTGLQQRQYSFSTAIGIFKSTIGLILMLSANWLSTKFLKRSVF
jgi:putative aldouronate transport system permease protein